MARAPSKKKSTQVKKKHVSAKSHAQIELAWVWSQYKAELTNLSTPQAMQKITPKNDPTKNKSTSEQTILSKERIISQNIRALSMKGTQTSSKRRELTKVDKYIMFGTAILSIVAVFAYEVKIRNSYSAQQLVSGFNSIGNSDGDYAGNITGSFDPRAVEFLAIASENIKKANSLQHRLELDEALIHLRKLSNSEIRKSISLLMNVHDPDTLTRIEPVVHALEKVISE